MLWFLKQFKNGMMGSVFSIYFLLFFGGLILSLILVYMLLYGGLGIVGTMTYYNTKANVEALAGLISACSSFSGACNVTYILQPGNCTLEINDSKVKMETPATTLQIGGKDVKIESQVAEMQIVKPKDVIIKESAIKCDFYSKKMILISKEGNRIEVLG